MTTKSQIGFRNDQTDRKQVNTRKQKSCTIQETKDGEVVMLYNRLNPFNPSVFMWK